MADEDRVTYVFEAKGGDGVRRELTGISKGFGATQRDADKAAKEVQELKNILNFTKNIKTTKDLEKAMKKHPSIARKLEAAYRKLREKEVNGLTGAFKNLTYAQKRQLVTQRKLIAETKKSRGITNSFKNAITGAIPQLGMMATGVGAATLGIQYLTRAFGAAIQKVKEFIKSTITLGAEQEEGRAIMIGLIGDIEAGTKAYDEFDARVTDSPFKREIYNMEEYAAAVGTGMGQAYMDAAEAGSRFNFTGKSFVENIYKMERGLLRSVNTLGQFGVVMEKAGFTVDEIRDGTLSYADAAELMKKAVHDLAEEQRLMAETTGTGSLNLLKNYWNDIKEDIGEALIKYLRPMGAELLKAVKEVRSLKDLWELAGLALKAVMIFGITPLKSGLTAIVGIMKVFNKLAEINAKHWAIITRGMERVGLIKPQAKKETYTPEAWLPPENMGRVGFNPFEEQIRGKYKETPGGGAGGGGYTAPGKELRMRPRPLVAMQEPPGQAAPGGMTEAQRRKKEAKERAAAEAEALKSKEVRAATTATMAMGLIDAARSGDARTAFANLGMEMANKLISALVMSGIASIFTGGSFGGGFLRGLGFEQEGIARRPQIAPIAETQPEAVMKLPTLRAIAQGFSPRGGRSDSRYGPEDYGGGRGATLVELSPKASALFDVAISKSAERGTELRGQREA